ncbi:hypothetical protein HWV62_7260 [Athelia sp. TMB]|nr:hypothetical protein HWV62_7260 [Athelia sp. TMB]
MKFSSGFAALLSVLTTGVVLASADDTSFDLYNGVKVQDSVVDSAASQLNYTLSGGNPYPNPFFTDRLGTTGPVLIQSNNLIEQLAHFVRERVPERTVHAKGAGAHGYFEVTTDVAAKYTMAGFLQKKGKKTSVTGRFSTIAGNLGNPDSVRDLRGLAFKFRTEEGNLDWALLNHPVFWLRDPAKFPHFIRSQKRDPQTHVTNYNNFWDYLSNNNESIYQVMRTFSDLGTPYGFRHMDGHAGNTFRLIHSSGEWHYAKFSVISDQGIKNNTNAEAIRVAGTQSDFGITDLYGAIESGNYPSWTVNFQIMSPADAEKFKYNVFDLTKEWLTDDVPYQEVGRIVLNQNPTNYFEEVEQIGFDPSDMPPGIGPTEDPTLQARLFAYGDAQRYRIGKNHKQLPVNAPINPVANFLRDGFMAYNNQGNRPNFMSTQDPIQLTPRPYNDDNHTIWVGGAVKYVSQPTELDFDLPRIFWGNLSTHDQDNLVGNVVFHLGQATDKRIKKKQLAIFSHVNATLGKRIAQGLNITS